MNGTYLARSDSYCSESHPLIFCTGPAPAQQVDSLILWLMKHTDAHRFYLPSSDYIWPHVMNKRVRAAVAALGGSIVGEEYFPVDHTDYRSTVAHIMQSGAQVVFNTTVPPGVTPFLQQLHEAAFTKRGGHIVCTYFEENFASLLPAEHVEGLYSCLDYYQAVSDPFSYTLLRRYDERFPGGANFTAGSAATGLYRGLKLWEAAVREAGTIEQAAVMRALDHPRIAEGPGGAAEMVPGQHHLRLNMYIGQVQGGDEGRRGSGRDRPRRARAERTMNNVRGGAGVARRERRLRRVIGTIDSLAHATTST